MTKRFYRDALQLSKDKKKQLMVIGDPCGGTYFQFISDLFPNCEQRKQDQKERDDMDIKTYFRSLFH